MRKYVIGMLAVVFAIVATAFTQEKRNVKPDPYNSYFSFDGTMAMEQADSTKYTWLPGGPTVECEPGSLHCVINADINGSSYPILRVGGSNAFLEKSTKE